MNNEGITLKDIIKGKKWKEFLKSYTEHKYNLLYVQLYGKFYCDGKLIYDNITSNEVVYFYSAIFEYIYKDHFN